MRIKFLRTIFTSVAFGICTSAFAADIDKLANDDWLLVKSANFEILTDLNEEKGRHLVEALESYRYFSTVFMKLQVLDRIKPLPILAIGSSSNFRKLDFPENWAGVFALQPSGYAAIANVKDYSTSLKNQTFARQVLFHEYNHFLIRFNQVANHYPTWYDEGMAEYWGSFKYDGEKIFIGDPKAIEGRIYDLLNLGGNIILDSEKLLTTTELPLTSTKESDKAAISRFYAQSFFLIHYFNSSPELRQSLANYISYLNAGYIEKQAFNKAFNMTYAELDKSAKSYLNKSLMMRVISIKDGKIQFPPPAISVTKLDTPGVYRQLSHILPLFEVTGKDDVKKLLEKNIQLNPMDADAKARLLMSGLADSPEKLAEDIAKIDPTNATLFSYRGGGLFENADMMRRAGLPGWEEAMKKARSAFRRAIKVDPTLSYPYLGLGQVYDFLPTSEPLAEGVVGYEAATLYKRDEQSFSDLADANIRMDKGLDALPSIRNAVGFSKNKQRSSYAIILDNLELLNDASLQKGEATAEGLRYASGSVYSGPVVDGKPQGTGKIVRRNGSYYEGTFNKGVLQSPGKLVTYSGHQYEGEFQNGIARGKGKVIYPEDFGSYTGDVYYAIPFGKGLRKYKDRTYEGDFWYSFPHGKGSLRSDDGKINLTGRWVYGGFEWPEENRLGFVGYVSDNGKREGSGVCIDKAASKIEWCEFKDGVHQTRQQNQQEKSAANN